MVFQVCAQGCRTVSGGNEVVPARSMVGSGFADLRTVLSRSLAIEECGDGG
jgi:hypothetical protein